MPKKLHSRKAPNLHKDMKGLRIFLNDMGEVSMNMPVEKINDFLKNIEEGKIDDSSNSEEE
jgi:hypothetical protein